MCWQKIQIHTDSDFTDKVGNCTTCDQLDSQGSYQQRSYPSIAPTKNSFPGTVDKKLLDEEEVSEMSIKLKDFARTDIESDPIRRSDDSEDEDISYLPAPSSGNILSLNNILLACQNEEPFRIFADKAFRICIVSNLKLYYTGAF